MKKASKIFIGILLVLVLALGGLTFYMYTQFTEANDVADVYMNQVYSYQRSVFVTTSDLKAGDILKIGENVEKQNIATALPAEFFISESDLFKQVATDVSVGTPIYKSMVVDKEINNLTRTLELSTVTLPLTLTNGSFVDVRIMFPNGEDYIVLSKKRVSNLFLEDCTFTTELNEEEIERLSSAIIDTFVVTGTKMYTTTYVAPNVQDASIPNYLVRKETIDILAGNPNLANVGLLASTINATLRTEMEERLANLTEEQLTAVQKGHDIEDTASASALIGVQNGDYEVDYDANIYDIEATDDIALDSFISETNN